ncbi:MAG: rRNA pseudouridine synthase [bacterium]|nr:rRNA pseudouridine synthase [bacterium]
MLLGKMYLLNYLQQTQGLSRRTITSKINAGQIFINQKKVENYKVELKISDSIEIKEKARIEKIIVKPLETKQYILAVNKPLGYVVSKSDPYNKIIYELLPPQYHAYYYLGRLDKDSHGLVLFTNDPKQVHEWTHPSKGIIKTYHVQTRHKITSQDEELMIKGIRDQEDILKAKKIKKIICPH